MTFKFKFGNFGQRVIIQLSMFDSKGNSRGGAHALICKTVKYLNRPIFF